MSDNLTPHLVQVGDAPVIIGTGADDLPCACGGSVLVRGHGPGMLLGISIQCARCGQVTTTPGLPENAVPPPNVRVVPRDGLPVPTPIVLPADTLLGDRDSILARDALTQPRPRPATPFELSAATLAALAAEYDRMSGGRLAADRAAVRSAGATLSTRLPAWPLAWAFEQVEPNIGRPAWWCLASMPDAVAAIQLAAFHEFHAVWSGHPLFDAMAASAASSAFSLHALAVFAAAQSLAAAGNRVRFAAPGPGQTAIDRFYLDNGPADLLPVHVRRLGHFDWPANQQVEQAAVRAAAIDALIASQTRINARQPGLLVLSVGSVDRQMDDVLITGLAQTLNDRWRKQRGLVGAALVLPNIVATGRRDRVTFGWTFLPEANPRFDGTLVRPGLTQGRSPSGPLH